MKTLFSRAVLLIFIFIATTATAVTNNIPHGDHIPNEMNVVIEIPDGSSPVKYEMDEKTQALFVNRFLSTAMFYPCNYGYVPQTLAKDGDPVDVLVITPTPLISGSVIRVRPIGMLYMTDEEGEDNKILAVPLDELTHLYKDVKSFKDIPAETLDKIKYFFEHYKDLEKNKWVKIKGWGDVKEAKKDIAEGALRYEQGHAGKAPSP